MLTVRLFCRLAILVALTATVSCARQQGDGSPQADPGEVWRQRETEKLGEAAAKGHLAFALMNGLRRADEVKAVAAELPEGTIASSPYQYPFMPVAPLALLPSVEALRRELALMSAFQERSIARARADGQIIWRRWRAFSALVESHNGYLLALQGWNNSPPVRLTGSCWPTWTTQNVERWDWCIPSLSSALLEIEEGINEARGAEIGAALYFRHIQSAPYFKAPHVLDAERSREAFARAMELVKSKSRERPSAFEPLTADERKVWDDLRRNLHRAASVSNQSTRFADSSAVNQLGQELQKRSTRELAELVARTLGAFYREAERAEPRLRPNLSWENSLPMPTPQFERLVSLATEVSQGLERLNQADRELPRNQSTMSVGELINEERLFRLVAGHWVNGFVHSWNHPSQNRLESFNQQDATATIANSRHRRHAVLYEAITGQHSAISPHRAGN